MSVFLNKVLGGRCLSVWGPGPLPPPSYTLYEYTSLFLFTQGKGWGGVGEPVRRLEGCELTRGVENTNMTDCIFSLLNSSKDDI